VTLDRDTALRGIGAIVLICLVGVAFVYSYVGALHDPKPHDVPVSVVGPRELISQIEAGDDFEAEVAADPAAAARDIDERRTYASLVAGPGGAITVTTAPAAGVAAAEAIESDLVPALKESGAKVAVREVHPLGSEDARGLSGFYLAVGWTVAGYLGATFLGLIFTTRPGLPRTGLRLLAIALLSILMGLLGAGTVHLMDAIDGSLIAAAGVGALTVFAVGAATVALQSALGLIGTGFAILIFVVLGNPSSSGPLPNEMLPGLWRTIGPYIPIGATVEMLRNISYFPAAGNLGALVVLVVWAVLGAGLALAFASRNQRFGRAEEQIAAATSS
jgi:hypothetical protein